MSTPAATIRVCATARPRTSSSQGGGDGPVLYRHEYSDGTTMWWVSPSSALENCYPGGSAYLTSAENTQAGAGPTTAPAYTTGANNNGGTGWVDWDASPWPLVRVRLRHRRRGGRALKGKEKIPCHHNGREQELLVCAGFVDLCVIAVLHSEAPPAAGLGAGHPFRS